MIFQGDITKVKSNFNGSNIFWAMKFCSRHGKFELMRVNHSARSIVENLQMSVQSSTKQWYILFVLIRIASLRGFK